MIGPGRLAQLLNGELSRKSCSFAEYILHCAPYVPPGAGDLLAVIKRIARCDREQAATLEDTIVALGGIPQSGMFDEGVADTNYLNLVYLCELLVRSRRECLELFVKRLDDSAGYPAVCEVLQMIIEQDRLLLRELEEALERHNSKVAEPEPGSERTATHDAVSCTDGSDPSAGGT